MPDPIRPQFAERPGSLEVEFLGPHEIELPCGTINCEDAAGVMVSTVQRPTGARTIGITLHGSALSGLTLQLPPSAARKFAAQVLGHCNEIDPKGVS